MPKRENGIDLREYDKLIRSVRYEEQKIRNWVSRIDKRRSELISKMEIYKKKNQTILAGIYAKEVNNLDLIREILNFISLKFLAVAERLSTLKIVLMATNTLKPLLKSLTELYPLIISLSANAEDVVKQLVTSYNELLCFVNPPEAQIRFNIESPEASQILKEVESKVEEELLAKFPRVPMEFSNETKLSDKMEELVETLAADGGLLARKDENSNIKRKILEYIKSKGDVNVYTLARHLNISPDKVIELLYQLADEGKIRFSD